MPPSQSSAESKGKEQEGSNNVKWGQGHKLGGRSTANTSSYNTGPIGAGGARGPRPPQRRQSQRSPSPEEDWGVDDDDVIVIDSD